MIGEINIYGVLVPPMLVWVAIAVVLRVPLLRAFDRFRLYRFFWHRALFDTAVLVILFGGVSAAAQRISEYVS